MLRSVASTSKVTWKRTVTIWPGGEGGGGRQGGQAGGKISNGINKIEE